MKTPGLEIVKICSFSLFSVVAIGVIVYLFWNQELQYNKPTPVPDNYEAVPFNTKIDVREFIGIAEENHLIFMHFFNSNCPCSKFNMKEFEQLSEHYKEKVKFYIVVENEEGKEYVSKYGLSIPVIADEAGILADICGVYSTPQAVMLDEEHRIYYRGNYNRARFCTKKETRFAEQALTYLIEGKNLPAFSESATTAYGCKIPSDEKSLTTNSN